jgi:hypothetical protein
MRPATSLPIAVMAQRAASPPPPGSPHLAAAHLEAALAVGTGSAAVGPSSFPHAAGGAINDAVADPLALAEQQHVFAYHIAQAQRVLGQYADVAAALPDDGRRATLQALIASQRYVCVRACARARVRSCARASLLGSE